MTIITKIEMGRTLSDAEKATRDAQIETLIAAGVTNGRPAATPNATSGVRAWTTTEAANAFVAWANANYNPPPESAVVLTI